MFATDSGQITKSLGDDNTLGTHNNATNIDGDVGFRLGVAGEPADVPVDIETLFASSWSASVVFVLLEVRLAHAFLSL